MNPDEEKLYKIARAHLNQAYAPYSHFKVAAVIMTQSGKVVTGVNVENASYPCGLCAERVALFGYVNQGLRLDPIKLLLITGNTSRPISPCGACRQVMAEFMNKETEVLLTNGQGNFKRLAFNAILPYYFTDGDLSDGQDK